MFELTDMPLYTQDELADNMEEILEDVDTQQEPARILTDEGKVVVIMPIKAYIDICGEYLTDEEKEEYFKKGSEY